MRVSKLSNERLEDCAESFDAMSNHSSLTEEHRSLNADLHDAMLELIDRRKRSGLEASLAYERAGGAIADNTVLAEPADEDVAGWYDLDTAEGQHDGFEMEVEYLESRGLLTRHPERPQWVCILDESEATS